MPRKKLQTLTEQMFYTLLCLRTPCCGMEILDRVRELTNGRVTIGSGTLYTLLEQFRTEGYVFQIGEFGRRRTYELTDFGRELLQKEYERIKQQAEDFDRMMGD